MVTIEIREVLSQLKLWRFIPKERHYCSMVSALRRNNFYAWRR